MVGTDQQQIRQDRHTKGILDSSFLSTRLVCTQAQVSREFSINLLHGPLTLMGTDHLSRDPLVQIGYQAFRLFWAQVPPSVTQHHSDVTDVRQTQAYARHLSGYAALISREAGHPDALRILAWYMGHQVCDRLSLNCLPCPDKGGAQAPARCWGLGSAWQHHLAIVLRAIRDLALHDTPLGLTLRSTAQSGYHKTRDDAYFCALLDQGILCPTHGFQTAIIHQMKNPGLGRRQDMQGFFGLPSYQYMDTPIARLQQAAKTPRCAGRLDPASKLFQGPLSRAEGLHADQPTQDKAMKPYPDTGPPTKQDGDKNGQIDDRNHSMPYHAQGGGDQRADMPEILF